MTKYILSTLFIAVSLLVFVFYTRGAYDGIQKKNLLISQYDSALAKAKRVQELKRMHINTRNSFSQNDMQRLSKMLPANSVDNIQLILDIEGIAKRYNIKLQKVDISKASVAQGNKNADFAPMNIGAQSGDGVKSLEVAFELVSSYDNFVRFMTDLERSLRIVDVSQLTVNPSGAPSYSSVFDSKISDGDAAEQSATPSEEQVYTFGVVLKTYWVSI